MFRIGSLFLNLEFKSQFKKLHHDEKDDEKKKLSGRQDQQTDPQFLFP
jgi:hypothetical protein